MPCWKPGSPAAAFSSSPPKSGMRFGTAAVDGIGGSGRGSWRGGTAQLRLGEQSRACSVGFRGNCHVYVDRAADLTQALAIALNAKLQRPGVCNSVETLLVHEAVAEAFLPRSSRTCKIAK